MNNNWKIFLVALSIILTGLIIYEFVTYKEPTFKSVTFDINKSTVWNKSNLSYADTVIAVGLEILSLDSVNISLRPIKDVTQSDNLNYDARILKGPGNDYAIYISDDLNRTRAVDVLAHELLHLKQFHTGKFVANKDYVVWKKDTILNKDIPEYDLRPWEVEVVKNQHELGQRLRTVLF